MSLSLSIPLHAKAGQFGPALAKLANGDLSRFTFHDGYVGGEVAADENDRKMLLRWLRHLPDPPRITLNQIAESSERLTLINNQPSISAKVKNGQIDLRLTFELHVPDNKCTLAYMFASVISAGLSENIRKCPHCSRWFFATPKAGPVQTYCSPQHQNAARQRRYRALKAKS